ncbi:insulinase family protein [bacterium]|nr:insulinase family protein [bacterium]
MIDSMDCFRLPLETVHLANGLRVLLHPDRSLPLVAVHVCYHVGSKDEQPTLTGLAHLFEHLMFEGSVRYDDDFFRPLREAGAMVNGSTGHDTTQYYEVIPSNFLERALWLEADRMGGLLPALSTAKLENQRSVVKNERMQRVDNQPYGRVGEELFSLLYPEPHPYHWPIIGWMDHLDMIEMTDVQKFFQQHYTPRRAVLTLSGDFDSDKALSMIEKHFGGIAGGSARLPLVPTPTRWTGEYRRTIDEPVALGRIDLAWPTVPRFAEDEAALDILSLILGESKDSLLRRRLEREEKIVHSLDAYHHTLALAGAFCIVAFALPGTESSRVEAIIVEEIARFCQQGPTDEELERAQRHLANRAYSRVETALSKAEMLQRYTFHRGEVKGDMLVDELARYQRVRSADLVRVAHQYLGENKIVVQVRPSPSSQRSSLGKVASSTSEKNRGPIDETLLPGPTPSPRFSMPTIESYRMGPVTVQHVTSRKLPRVTMQLIVDAGSLRESSSLLGQARLTADCLEEGTLSRDPLALARELERLGSTISVDSGIETVSLSLRSLRSTLADSVQIWSDILTNPRFDAADLAREKDRLLAELAHRQKQPRSLADDLIDEVIFGPTHPYGRPCDGSLEDVPRITRDDLFEHHHRYYVPMGAHLVVVGDVDRKEIEPLLRSAMGNWLEQNQATPRMPHEAIVPEKGRLHVIDRPEATQSVIRIGRLSTRRDTPDYYAMVLLNTILGGSFSSRLNAKLREEKGLTYGVQSSFVLRQQTGSFLAGTDVDSRVTREALQTMIEVIRGPIDREPVTSEELAEAKAYITRRFPARFETQSGILSQLSHTAVYGLPIDYYAHYLDHIAAVTLGDVSRVANDYLAMETMKFVLVGRREEFSEIEDKIESWIRGESV